MRAKKYMQKALVVTLASVMLAGSVAPALPVEAATKRTVVVSNEREVLVAGRTYFVKNENATNFKSSNESIATIDENGKITPLKTGYVTISATVDGETVKSKFMCVSKFGVTASQTKIDKMLEAENVKNISIVTTKDADFEIAEGDYAKKTLTVKAPNADVNNYGTFKKIKVKDVADNTFRNYKPNKFMITDKNFRFADKSNGSTIEVAEGASGRVIVQGKNAVIKTKGNVEVKPQGKNVSIAKVEVNGGKIELNLKKLADAIKEVLIQKAAEVKITAANDKKADVKVTVGEDAKGTTITSDTSVDLVVKAEVTINLTGNADGSKIDVADGVKVTVKVDASVDGSVSVGDTEVKAGETATVDETGKVEVTETTTGSDSTTGDTTTPSVDVNAPSGGGSSSSGGNTGGSTTTAIEVKGVYADGKTTYTFSKNIADFASFTADIAGTYEGTIAITDVSKLLDFQETVGGKFENAQTRVQNWINLDKDVSYEYGAASVLTVKANKGSNEKEVVAGDYTAKVSLNAISDTEVEATIVSNGQTTILTATSADTFEVKKNNETYTVTFGANTITVDGKDTTGILKFTNVK